MTDRSSLDYLASLRARTIIAHPLIAMTIALFIFIVVANLGALLGILVAVGEPARAILHTVINVALVVVAYKLLIAPLGQHRRDDLPARAALPDLLKGIVAGGLLFGAIVAVASVLGVYRIVGREPLSIVIRPLFTTAIAPGFMEELLFRGILFRWLEEWGGSWIALLVTSALFGIVHILNPGATWFSSCAIALEAGLLLGAAYMLKRNLWLPIGLHGAWNFTQGAIFGVPVSGIPAAGIFQGELSGSVLLTGGRFGLEASIIGIVIATSAGIWFLSLAIKRGDVVQPSWRRSIVD